MTQKNMSKEKCKNYSHNVQSMQISAIHLIKRRAGLISLKKILKLYLKEKVEQSLTFVATVPKLTSCNGQNTLSKMLRPLLV